MGVGKRRERKKTYHSSSDSIERVRSETSTSGDGPSESERGEEVTLEGTDKDDSPPCFDYAREG